MKKVILNTEIQNVELKPGQVICLYDSKIKTHHNMIVFPCKNRVCAVEQLFSTDSIIVNTDTGSNCCYLDRQKYPQTWESVRNSETQLQQSIHISVSIQKTKR